jgi:hypothetical protein
VLGKHLSLASDDIAAQVFKLRGQRFVAAIEP